MSDNSPIEWTDATWNPTVGCSVLTPGCTNCYAMKLAGRLEAMGQPIYAGHTQKTKAGFVWNGKVSLSNWGQVIKPLSWKKPRRIFVNSMSDLFHEALSDAEIDKVFAVMALCPQHTFQVLTKRDRRMFDYLYLPGHQRPRILDLAAGMACDFWEEDGWRHNFVEELYRRPWPLPNVWLGVSVEDQERADERIPLLLETPAAVRFLSCEPLLGPVTFRWASWQKISRDGINRDIDGLRGIDWVIVGGESGPGARPMHPDWARSLRDQCAAAGVPFFFKQWGEWLPGQQGFDPTPYAYAPYAHGFDDGAVTYRVGKKAAGRLLDGREHSEFPKAAP